MDYTAHPTAVIDAGASIGRGSQIWHFCHIMAGAKVGSDCSLGQNVMVADGVMVGNNVKIQNNVSLYTGTVVEDGVFLGPSCVLTNISNPRSEIRRRNFYEKTVIRRGATVGANATVVCGITLGRFCFIAAGAVVTRDVADYGMIAGVPGKMMGWMSRHGHRLRFDPSGLAKCPESKLLYELKDNLCRCLDLPEESPLPPELSLAQQPYRVFKATARKYGY